jgi:hypothetical protein
MGNYGSPRKFRSRYKTYHRQAAGHPTSWTHWVDPAQSGKTRSPLIARRVFAVILASLIGTALCGFVLR